MSSYNLRGADNTYSDLDIWKGIDNHLRGSKFRPIPMENTLRMVAQWKAYKRDGMGPTWILNKMKKKRIDVAGFGYVLNDDQIVGFVSAMKRIEKGDMPTDPAERPSWSEAYDEGVGKVVKSDGMRNMVLAAAAILALGLAVHGFAGGVARR